MPRKVAHGAASIQAGLVDRLTLGDLTAQRDWGYAPDYVRAMWLMLQQDTAADYIVASGETHSVEELVEIAFSRVGLDWRELVVQDDRLRRGRAKLYDLVGDATLARAELGWEPSLSFRQLVESLVDAEVESLQGQDAASR